MINHDGKVCVGDVWGIDKHDDGTFYLILMVEELELPKRVRGQGHSFVMKDLMERQTLIHRNEQETCEDCEVGYWIRGGDQKNLPVYKKTVQTLIKEGMAIVLRNFCPECGKDLRGSDD